MNLERFILVSIMFHALALAGFYHAVSRAPKLEAIDTPIIARLILPEGKPSAKTPEKTLPPAPPPPPAPKIAKKPPPASILPQRPPSVKEFPHIEESPYLKQAPLEQKAAPYEKAPAPAPYIPGRQRLFDPGVINEQVAKSLEKEKPPPSLADNSITFSTKEFRYISYMRRLKEKIEGSWAYPRQAIERKIYGDLEIKFTIRKDGRLGSLQLMRTSGHSMLDEAALKALRDGAPYWPLPADWGLEEFPVHGHFIYTFYGMHLR